MLLHLFLFFILNLICLAKMSSETGLSVQSEKMKNESKNRLNKLEVL